MSPRKDAVEVLVSDHRAVEKIFDKLEAGSGRRGQLVSEMVRELSIHDAVEKQILYPVVRRQLPRGPRTADKALSEHQRVEELLAELDGADLEAPSVQRRLTSLMTKVRRHVREEEEAIFPALRDAVTKKFLLELRDELDKAKRMAPTHPHPHAPNSALGTTVTGLGAAAVDRVRDALGSR
jgi:hemerythrin superfamily protein